MKNDYPPIADYGFISDCHSTALISKSGSIDWCCMPRIDSASCFGRLLDWTKGGYCRIVPTGEFQISRRYIEDTLILETLFQTSEGEARLIDCITTRIGGEHQPHNQLIRVLEGVKGQVEIAVDIVPVFDYGAVKPWIRRYQKNAYAAFGGNNCLLISGDLPLDFIDQHHLAATITTVKGEKRRLSFLWRPAEDVEEELDEIPEGDELDERLQNTIHWWKRWTSQADVVCPYSEQVKLSAIVLKGLSHAPTGAIAAAATTSLPETRKGKRNWDYRFSWIRDSSFATGSLVELGYSTIAKGFRRFIERSAAGSAEQLQVLFGVGGERRLYELKLNNLEGYQGAKPVRLGNAAFKQVQLDGYGDIVSLAWLRHRQGENVGPEYWKFLVDVVNHVIKIWGKPDQGIWEIRGAPRHFVHSKASCWSAVDRAVEIAESQGLPAPLSKWKNIRDKIRESIESRGYDPDRGLFIQAFEHPSMDSALLLLPSLGFVDYCDERFVRTTDAIRRELTRDGLLLRYHHEDDPLKEEEGCFLACTFWLATCLARQQRHPECHAVMDRVLATANDLGLFSEEYDTVNKEMLGNFPQALSHLALIDAALALAQTE